MGHEQYHLFVPNSSMTMSIEGTNSFSAFHYSMVKETPFFVGRHLKVSGLVKYSRKSTRIRPRHLLILTFLRLHPSSNIEPPSESRSSGSLVAAVPDVDGFPLPIFAMAASRSSASFSSWNWRCSSASSFLALSSLVSASSSPSASASSSVPS